MIEKLPANWTLAIDLEYVPDILNNHARKINEIIDTLHLDEPPTDALESAENPHHDGPY